MTSLILILAMSPFILIIVAGMCKDRPECKPETHNNATNPKENNNQGV